MGYPPQQPGPYGPQQPYGPPQPGYPQPGPAGPPAPPPQPGYGPPVPPQGPPPPQPGGYGPPPQQGYQPPGAPGGYGPPQPDWQSMYDNADASAGGGTYAEGWSPAHVTACEYGLTRNQDKYAWQVTFGFDGGADAGRSIKSTQAISPFQNNGEPNPGGTARLYKDLGKLGIPVGEKFGGAAGSQGFWQLGWTGEQVAAYMVQAAVPVDIKVEYDEKFGGYSVGLIRPRRAGAPAAPPAPQQAPQAASPQPGYGPPQQAPAPAQAAPQYSYGSPPQTTQAPVPPGYQPPGAPPGVGQGIPPQNPVSEFQQGTTWNPGQPAAAPPQQYAPPQQPAAGPPAQAPGPMPPNGYPQQGQPAAQPQQGQAPPPPWRNG